MFKKIFFLLKWDPMGMKFQNATLPTVIILFQPNFFCMFPLTKKIEIYHYGQWENKKLPIYWICLIVKQNGVKFRSRG